LLVRLVVTDGATCRGAENAMVAGKMPRHSTHNGALDAAFGLGWRRYSDEYHRNGGVFEDLFHPVRERRRGLLATPRTPDDD
jgi:hypothetical protein